ncbi:DUF1684 domain-containing protein [Angustibacter peucedani]
MSEQEHRAWHAARLARLVGPRGALALTGTHWLEDELVLDGVPGTWRAVEGSSPPRATLTAAARDSVVVDGAPLDGTVEVVSDLLGEPTPVVAGRLQLVLVDREGVLGVRVYDPDAHRRSGFDGVETFPYDPALERPATFEPYETEQVVPVDSVDGVRRTLPIGGVVAFELAGTTVRLAVERDPDDGVLQAVFRDRTGDRAAGGTAYPFRFLNFPPPDGESRTVADLNQVFLPPCAFSDHFVCPLPPPGNSLDVAVEGGEARVRWAPPA